MKKIPVILALSLCAALLAGCRKTEPASAAGTAAPQAVASSASASEAAAPAGTGKTIEPLPVTLDMAALNDCTFAVSFPASAVGTDASGAPAITLTVYDCDKFDLVDISQLAPGDTIVIEGRDIAVTTVEQSGSCVTLNGGVEQGGWDLTTEEDGVYLPTILDAGPLYHPLGEVTLPLDPAFVYADCSDLDNPEVQYTADEFVASMAGSDAEFVPQAATVCVAGGNIIRLTQNYIP